MTGRPNDTGKFDALTKREDVLRRLSDDPAYKRDLVEKIDQSRSTINRAIDELEECSLVERVDDGFVATTAGRLALARLDAFRGDLDDIVDAEPVVDPLGLDAPLPAAAVAGSDAVMASDPAPYRALERFHDDLADARSYRAVLPALDDPRHVRLLYEHVVTDANAAELVVAPAVLDTLRTEFPRRTAAMAETDGFSVRVGDVPSFALALVEPGEDAPDESDPEMTVHVVVFTEDGGVRGTLTNDRRAAIRWAETLYADVKDEAAERTNVLVAGNDGGTAVRRGDHRGTPGDRLPVALEREGFVRLDVSYFRDEPVADPTTAWRAGLTLPEVHTGYAVERTLTPGDDAAVTAGRTDAEPGIATGTRPCGGVADDAGRSDAAGGAPDAGGSSVGDESAAEGGDGASRDAQPGMAETLTAELTAGTDCVVVGLPGSGKSTVCKRVACKWYDADRGPVLYRKGGRGRPFESVSALVDAVEAADGHALVVVEDAVRPDADDIFGVIDRVSGRDGVSFLLDAREGEWRNPPGDVGDAPDLAVVPMPPLDDADAERLVAHFERTTGGSVGVPAARLRTAVRDAAASGDANAPGEVLLLLHRLATYADPLADGPTSLEASVADVYADFASDDLALDVAVLANALNAAGVEVDPGALYAVADTAEYDAVDAAIDRLEGRVLFPQGDGAYRTVHEAWSVAFLAHLLDAEGEALAAERFGDCVTAYLALANDAGRRDRIARHRGGLALASVADDPGEWADDAAEAVYSLARERPKLAPLFGDGSRDSVALPATCSDAVVAERPVWLGRAFLDAGYFDAAERAFERLPDDGTARAFERRLGLSSVADKRGDYEAAVAHAEACQALADDLDDPAVLARADRRLGRALANREDFEAAEPCLRRALDRFEDLGDQRGAAATLDYLGAVARHLQKYDDARENHERSLALSQELGDRRGEARTLRNLGSVALDSSDLDAAREYYERSLDIARHLGNRDAVATTLENLGLVARHQGEYEDAREYHQRSLAASEDLGDRHGEARSLGNLGLLAKKQDDYEAATEYYERTLALHGDLGLQHGEAKACVNLAEVAVQQDDVETCREYLDRATAMFEDLDDQKGQAICANIRGSALRRRGDYDAACAEFTRSIELFSAVGIPQGRAVARRNHGEVLAMQGDSDAAREEWRTALETFGDIGAPQDALETLEHLVETCRDAGDDADAEYWCERARDLLADAPSEVAAEHREWVDRHLDALTGD